MDEAEWLVCTDPIPMLMFVRGKASERKVRLFACACCRRVWHSLVNERSREAVRVAESFADGSSSSDDLKAAYRPAYDASNEAMDGAHFAAALTAERPGTDAGLYAADGVQSAFRGVELQAVEAAHVGLVWEVFANPFCPSPPLPSVVLTWNNGIVRRIAEAIYQERQMPDGTLDNARLTVLADALLDASCDNEELIAHCREPGPHVRGCWVIDLVLAKQ
jgi:hypothetical protein